MREETLRGWSFILQNHYEQLLKKYSLNLRPARVFISDIGGQVLGLWHRGNRIIEISLRLIEHGNWYQIEHTLKHELAHQVVDEIYAAVEKPHGETFRKVCLQLGIDSGASFVLKTPIESSLQKKISKLLALSNSSNEHESSAALAKVQELSCKYNIDLIESQSSEYSLMPLGEIRKRIPRYEHTLMTILADFYFVKPLQNFRLDSDGDKVGWQFEIYGSYENLKLAEYVYYFLRHQGDFLWIAYKEAHGVAVSRQKRVYLSGLYEGFHRTLKEDREKALEKYALVKLRDEKLEDFFRELNPRIRQRSIKHRIDPGVYNDGITQGKKLKVVPGLAKKENKLLKGLLGVSR